MGHVVAIVGPTAVGKSALALDLARTFNGEIINADSRQVYHCMDIGTAKPGPEKVALVPHHLIDVINPDEGFSLAQYKELASRTIVDIQKRNRLPLLVGGTGQYVWAVLEGWEIPRVPPDPAFRRNLEERAAAGQIEELYQELLRVDPEAAQKIDPRNVRRVIRALEVSRQTGVPFSQLQRKKPPPFRTLIIGLTVDRAELYRRIDARLEGMVAQGLVEEVKKLVSMGYGFDLPSMSSIGYREIGMYLRGELTLEEAIEKIKHGNHRLARQQYNWFRTTDPRIRWFDITHNPQKEIEAEVAEFLSA